METPESTSPSNLPAQNSTPEAIEKAKGMLSWFKSAASDFDAKVSADLAGTQNTHFQAMNNFFTPIFTFVDGPLFEKYVGDEGKIIRGKVDELNTVAQMYRHAKDTTPRNELQMQTAEAAFEKGLRELEAMAKTIEI